MTFHGFPLFLAWNLLEELIDELNIFVELKN